MTIEHDLKIEIFWENLMLATDEMVAAGKIRKSVVTDFADIMKPRLRVENDHVVDMSSGETDPVKFLNMMVAARPHWAPTVVAADLEEQAFGAAPSLTARGILLKQLGPAEYEERIEAWKADMKTLRPGTRPTAEGEKQPDAPKQSSGERNPWSDHPVNLDKHGRYTAAALGRQSSITRSLGIEKAAAMAKQYSFIGATKPGGRMLISRA